MDTEVRVKEAMSSHVITIGKDATVDKAAKIMSEKNFGCIIVVENDNPIGIITERDICYGVVARNRIPNEVKVAEVMSTPLRTVTPDRKLTEASRIMVKNNIRRLPVIKDKKLVGIITNKDILAIAPETIEILMEIQKMNEHAIPSSKEVPDIGTCETCGDYGVTLYEVDGTYICEHCRDDRLGG